jgi:exonuclease SbcC
MRLRTIQLQNYRRYRSAEIEFPDGLVSITGQNGSGKSTLLEAVAWALFGNQSEIVRTDKESIKRQGAAHTEQCMVRVEFDFEDANYVVERTMKGKTLTMNATLYAGDNIMARGTEEVSEAIVKLFGMDHKAFFISVFARQKELNALTSLPKGDRKKMVLRLLDIENIDEAIRRIREDSRMADDAIKSARKELVAQDGSSLIDKFREELVELESREAEISGARTGLEAELAKMEKVHGKLKTGLAAQEKLARERDKLSSEKAVAESRIAELEKQLKALARDVTAIEVFEKELEDASDKAAKAAEELESIIERRKEAGAERDGIRTEMASLKAGVRQLMKEIKETEDSMSEISDMGPDSDCPTCRRRLGDTYAALLATFEGHIEKRRKSIKQKETAIARFESKLAECDARADALSKRESRLREKLREFEVLKTRVERAADVRERQAKAEKRLSEHTLELNGTIEKLKGIDFEPKEYEKARKALEELNLQIRATEKKMMTMDAEKARYEERRGSMERDLGRLEKLDAEYREKRVEVAELESLAFIMGEFRKHLISRIRPALAAMSSEFMGILTDGRYNEIELSEDYEISIRDAGEFHDIERFSGGEKDLANLSLRLAISDIIATRHGTNSFDMIVLDEIFGSQDSNRKRTLLQTLNGLSNRFKQIFLITHVDDIKELMGNVIQISENPDGTSRAEVTQ